MQTETISKYDLDALDMSAWDNMVLLPEYDAMAATSYDVSADALCVEDFEMLYMLALEEPETIVATEVTAYLESTPLTFVQCVVATETSDEITGIITRFLFEDSRELYPGDTFTDIAVVVDGELLFAGTACKIKHLEYDVVVDEVLVEERIYFEANAVDHNLYDTWLENLQWINIDS